jgi:hypothetical protein
VMYCYYLTGRFSSFAFLFFQRESEWCGGIRTPPKDFTTYE